MWRMQAPYDVKVHGWSYLSLLDLSNAEAVGNVTQGTMEFKVTQPYQDLAPDYGNQVNVTLILAVKSQVSPCYQVIVIARELAPTWTARCPHTSQTLAPRLSIEITC